MADDDDAQADARYYRDSIRRAIRECATTRNTINRAGDGMPYDAPPRFLNIASDVVAELEAFALLEMGTRLDRIKREMREDSEISAAREAKAAPAGDDGSEAPRVI